MLNIRHVECINVATYDVWCCIIAFRAMSIFRSFTLMTCEMRTYMWYEWHGLVSVELIKHSCVTFNIRPSKDVMLKCSSTNWNSLALPLSLFFCSSTLALFSFLCFSFVDCFFFIFILVRLCHAVMHYNFIRSAIYTTSNFTCLSVGSNFVCDHTEWLQCDCTMHDCHCVVRQHSNQMGRKSKQMIKLLMYDDALLLHCGNGEHVSCTKIAVCVVNVMPFLRPLVAVAPYIFFNRNTTCILCLT